MSDVTNPGRLAYETYRRKSSGKSLVSGAELPEWERLNEPIRDAWDAAGRAVAEAVLDETERVADRAAEAIKLAAAETRDRLR